MKSIEIFKKMLHFHKRFTIAYESVDSAEIVFVRVVDENYYQGIGSAAPDTEVTGEKFEEVYKVLSSRLNKDFFQDEIKNWDSYHEKIQGAFKGYPSAQAACEEAILNLFCNQKGIIIKDLFGNYREKCDIAITIGIDDLDKIVDEVEKRLLEGFKIIKLKCGTDLDEDLKRIIAVRKVLPRNCDLILDANQGYTFDEAKFLLHSLKDIGVSLIEQPVDASDFESLKKLSLLTEILIIADESVVNFQDAVKLMTENYVDGVNIKLMKCGGIVNFIDIFKLAKKLNKIVMIGCMYESNVSITTAAHLAMALPIDYVDLDSGPLDFYDDPIIGGAKVENGQLSIGSPLQFND